MRSVSHAALSPAVAAAGDGRCLPENPNEDALTNDLFLSRESTECSRMTPAKVAYLLTFGQLVLRG